MNKQSDETRVYEDMYDEYEDMYDELLDASTGARLENKQSSPPPPEIY
jgi:hypothetical protein